MLRVDSGERYSGPCSGESDPSMALHQVQQSDALGGERAFASRQGMRHAG